MEKIIGAAKSYLHWAFFHERVELPGTLCLTVQSWDDIDSL